MKMNSAPDHSQHLPSPQAGISRRGFIAAAAVAGAAIALPATGTQASTDPAAPAAPAAGSPAAKARNVIFLVADGMAAGSIALLDQHLYYTTGKHCVWLQTNAKASTRRALQSNHSADSPVTDSAAASSAWSTGIKHNLKSLCVAPDGSRPRPLLLRARQSGRRIGCVTTTTVTHATPAGFYANLVQRGKEAQIGEQLLTQQLDVAMGGGAAFVDMSTTLGKAALADGVLVLNTRDELAAAKARISVDKDSAPLRRLLGLFNRSHLSYVLDRLPTEPSLVEMADVALSTLGAGPDPFFIQIEAGRIDHAAHNNDAGTLLGEMLEFDAVLERVLEYVSGRNDTLLVVTTDHATANPGLTLYGKAAAQGLKSIAAAKHSFDWLRAQVPDSTPVADRGRVLGNVVAEARALAVGTEAKRMLQQAFDKEQADPFLARASLDGVLGSILSNDYGVGFVSVNHTADLTDIIALGPGSETLPGYLDNTDLHGWLCAVADIPTLS